MATSLGQMLEESCRAFPERTALVQDERRLTYRDLNRAVNSLGNWFMAAGIGKGDRVAVMLPNCPEFVIAYFALQKIGAVAVTLNVLSTSYELLHLLGDSGAKGLVTTTELSPRIEEIKDDLPLCRCILLHDERGDSPFWSALEKVSGDLETAEARGDDPAVMIYTAGLTGKPLGAVLTQQNLLHQADLLKVVCGTTEKDRGLSLIPLFHSFGAVVNMLCPIRVGACVVLIDHFSIDGIFSSIEREKITYIAAVPQLYLAMLMHKELKYDIGSLALCITGGAAMPVEYFTSFEEKFGRKIMEGYGLTEASPVCSFSKTHMRHKPGSVGVVVPGVEARVVDDGGRDLPPGEIGELIIRGKNVMQGYFNDAEATAKVIKNGWLYTGDLAVMDAEGYIFIKGLKKRMIITSGFNVYPREVEMVLDMHPAVRESRAEGLPNALRGEVVRAMVVRNPGMAVEGKELVRHCRKYLSSYKVPRQIEFVEDISSK